jgi:vanillate O-demethylase ferredoxin subunit
VRAYQTGGRQDDQCAPLFNASGSAVPSSCVSPLCGTCKLRFLRDEVDHKDYILSEE